MRKRLSNRCGMINPSVADDPTQAADLSAPYRPNVAALLERADGHLFVGERIDRRGAWQFPQGGVDEAESYADALIRELEEEVGLRPRCFEVLEHRGGYRYTFPKAHRKWGRYIGQEQMYFRCRFLGEDSDIQLDAHHPEFQDFRWIPPAEFDFDWLPKFKREVYRQVLADFYGVGL